MMVLSEFSEIMFSSNKIHVHHWPKTTPVWSESRRKQVDNDINKNNEKMQVTVTQNTVRINDYEFGNLLKIGITIPLFKKESTIVFEGHCEEFYAHVHITNKDENYLEVFNRLMHWRAEFFPNNESG